ncbi:MAG: tRNA pseudouridine(38-40) synthase TruA [Bacteroidales bacterium]|nr:tRNA pseudouridine(38-40) synthase TruA [Bacteroidales bacterium]
MRYLIKLSYRGADFCGWQVQPDAPSVQQTLEKALSTLLHATVCVTGAGRTDTGVNAIGYIAHFDAADGLDTRQLCYKLNAILPRSVVIHDIVPAAADFHARFDAELREYTYFLHRKKDPFVEAFSYLYTFPEVDFDAMDRAAESLRGCHDFRCFEKTGTDTRTSLCTVMQAGWHRYTPTYLQLTGGAGGDDYWYFRISADRFLRNMVRAVVGTLLEVGRGKRSMEEFRTLVLPPDYEGDGVLRSAAGESAPGHALFLSAVRYADR